jgi:hypothetical protein
MKIVLLSLLSWVVTGFASGAVATVANFQSLPAGPTEYEQYLLELLNRARANPDAEVTRTGLSDLNEGPPTTTITNAAKQPLAFHQTLITVARDHVAWSLNTNTFSHDEGTAPDPNTVNWTGDSPFDRMASAGYAGGAAENMGASFSSSPTAFISTTDVTEAAASLHDNLFIDVTTTGRGHRINMMDDDFTEVGIGFFTDSDYALGGTNLARASFVNYDFGTVGQMILTGVIYNDLDGDAFYTPGTGEAMGGVVVNAYQDGVLVGTTTAWGSGGYSLDGLTAGTYDIEFVNENGEISVGQSVTIDAVNVKLDGVDLIFIPEPSVCILYALSGLGILRRRRA